MIALWYMSFIILCFNYNALAGSYEALIFDGQKHSFIYKPKANTNTEWSTWDTACPASNEQQRQFAKEHSFYNERALFIQKKYNENTAHTSRAGVTDICDEAFKLSMVIGENAMALEFGYEMYYESSTHSTIRENFYNEYLPVGFILESLSAWKDTNPYSLLKSFNVKDTNFLLDGQQMKFLWLPLFKVWYPFSNYEFRKIVYEIHKNNIDPTLPCEDYGLGQELFEFHEQTRTGHRLYSKENQMAALGEAELPPLGSEGACEPAYDCLTKWQLIPSDQFRFGYSTPLSCSNLTTVPIWKSTIEGIMKKLDLYLYTLSRVSGTPLHITAGVAGTLQLPRKLWMWQVNRNIYLNDTSKLAVPKIIYKMAKFESNQCEGSSKLCWYGIVIAIHNGPYFVEEDRICEQDKSGELGWEEIKYETWSYEGAQSKFIYVCSISKETFLNLDLNFKQHEFVQDLSLLRFPYFDARNEPSWRNMKKATFEELHRLSKFKEKLRLDENEIIERPSIDFEKYNDSQASYDDNEDVQVEQEGTSTATSTSFI